MFCFVCQTQIFRKHIVFTKGEKIHYYDFSILYLLITYVIVGYVPVVTQFHFYFGECNMLLDVVAYEVMYAKFCRLFNIYLQRLWKMVTALSNLFNSFCVDWNWGHWHRDCYHWKTNCTKIISFCTKNKSVSKQF